MRFNKKQFRILVIVSKIIKISSLCRTFVKVWLLEGRRERKFGINISNLLPKLDSLVLLQFMQIENMEYDVYNNSNIRDDIAQKKIVKGNVAFLQVSKSFFNKKKNNAKKRIIHSGFLFMGKVRS